MAVRFERHIKFSPLRLNLPKSGIGVKANRYSSVGAPGTGLSWRTTVTTGEKRPADVSASPAPILAILVAVLIIVLYLMFR